jgi:hypothetical protein
VGQAGVEHIGIVVVVAIVLAALGVWATSQLGEGRPPPLPDRLIAPVEPPPVPQAALPDLGIAPRTHRANPVLHGLNRAVRVGRRVRGVAERGVRAYTSGFVHGIASSVGGFVRDPVGSVVGGASLLPALVRDPAGFARAQIAAGAAYVRILRTLPPDVAYEKAARDLGGLSADVAITRGKSAAAKAAWRAIRRPEPLTPGRASGPPKVSR